MVDSSAFKLGEPVEEQEISMEIDEKEDAGMEIEID
jgi:hypothetical protein